LRTDLITVPRYHDRRELALRGIFLCLIGLAIADKITSVLATLWVSKLIGIAPPRKYSPMTQTLFFRKN
jgi:hypothetical protein